MSIMNRRTEFYNNRWWVMDGERIMGAYSTGYLRLYVFPLYTPAGTLVLQESPADHPHHQGICFGLNVNGHDMWNHDSFGAENHRQIADVVCAQHRRNPWTTTFPTGRPYIRPC